jgi:hypothetical protein
MKILFYIIISFFFYIPNTAATENEKSEESNNEFQRINKGYTIDYRKLESSGCFTEISFHNNSSGVGFSYGDYFCRKNPKERIETISEIAESISEIITYYQLEKEIRARKCLYISFGDEDLIQYINNDESWPKDIYAYVDGKFKNYEDKSNFIYEIAREVIIKSKIYDPFMSILSKMGCRMILSKIFVEGISNKNIALTKKHLLKSGILTNDAINKEKYPSFKGPITFDLTCDENTNL